IRSQTNFWSSMAATSSPRRGRPAWRRREADTVTGSAPIPVIPSALARRRAGSMVSTITRLSAVEAMAAAGAALPVVFPPPPLPQQMTTSRPPSTSARRRPRAARTSSSGAFLISARGLQRRRDRPGGRQPRPGGKERDGHARDGHAGGEPARKRLGEPAQVVGKPDPGEQPLYP